MNIDERLGALTQSLEILNGLQHANEARFTQIGEDLEKIRKTFEAVHDSIKGLERIAVIHEQRLDDLDKR